MKIKSITNLLNDVDFDIDTLEILQKTIAEAIEKKYNVQMKEFYLRKLSDYVCEESEANLLRKMIEESKFRRDLSMFKLRIIHDIYHFAVENCDSSKIGIVDGRSIRRTVYIEDDLINQFDTGRPSHRLSDQRLVDATNFAKFILTFVGELYPKEPVKQEQRELFNE